jgi:hypothetical protein
MHGEPTAISPSLCGTENKKMQLIFSISGLLFFVHFPSFTYLNRLG